MDWLSVLGWGEDQINALRAIAYLYARQGKWDTATTLFEGLCILTNNAPYDVKTLGALYLQQGNAWKALNFLEKALKVEPNDPMAQLNRAKALLGLGLRRQGLTQAATLVQSKLEPVAKQAQALVIAYR